MKRVALFASATVVSAGVMLGQSQNGSISGVVTDQGGAVVAGAAITITNVNTGAVRNTTSDRSGTYNVQGLSPQDYRVAVTAPGFAASEAKLNVSVGSANVINVKLAVGQESVTIDVAANSLAGINLENAEQSQVIDSAQILELPTETRNAYDFVGLSGSVSSDPSASARGVQGFNLNGARSASTEILLDGIENTGLFAVGVATQVPVDSVQEYRVITNNFGPEYGRASGGVVSVLTKGGTNKFHGTAYEFYRPSTFASNSYYNNANGISKKRFVRNAFGYSIGGPIIKDKLFFFNNTEWTRVRSSNVVQFYIPTAQFIAASNSNTQAFFQKFGTVSGTPTGKVLTLGQIGGAPGYVSTSFAGDRTTLESKFPGVFNDNFPMLQQVNVTVPVDAGGGTPVNQYNTDGRIDFNLGTKTQMFGRYVLYNQAFFSGSVNNSPYAGYNTSETVRSQNLVYGLTHTFTDRFTAQLQIGLLRYNDNQPLGANPVGPTMFVNAGAAPTIANNQFVFPGYNEKSAGNGLPSGGPQNNIVVSPDFTILRGRHTFTFGGAYDYIRDNHTFAIYANAQEALLSAGTNGALVNFQAGVFNYFQANLDPQGKFPCVKDLVSGVTTPTSACTINTPISQPSFARSNRYHEGAGYFNDTFKATPRLTLNAGLRYELYGTQHNKNSALDSNFYFGTSGSLQDRIRAGKILNVNSAAPAGVQQPNGRLWNMNLKQFAPRLAFAYDLTGDGKTSLRGGYGISYERNFGNVTYNVALNPPAQLAISFTNVDVGGQIPISTGVLGSFSSGPGVSKAIPPGTVRAVDPKIKPAYAQFFSLSVERQLAGNLTLGLAYNGSRGIHNYSIANYNRSYYGRVYEGDAARYQPSGAVNTNRLNPQFTSINVRAADGDSYYHGLNLSARASNLFNTGLTLTSNYTYSHSTDNTSSTFTDGGSNNVNSVAYFDPFNHALDHGNSDFDQKHRISVGLIYQVPFAGSGLSKRALGGWEFGGIFQAATGTPFSMYDCGQTAITVCPRARFVNQPNYQRTGNSTPTPGTPDQFAYINFPTYYTAGTTKRNPANYPTYVDPVVGAADLPTIIGGYDTFPGGMTARNAFRGPGNFSFNADLNKRLLITEHVSLQLRAELYNVLNHANSYLNLSGANDVSSTPYVSVYKNGPGQGGNRQLQLAGKLIF